MDIKAYREQHNLSRRALAELTGLTEGKIWRIENKGVINDDERDALQRVLGGEPLAIPRPTPSQESTDAQVEDAEVASHEPTDVVRVIVEDRPAKPVDLAALAKIVERSFERYLSNSEIQTFKRCRRKWWLAWHRGLKLKSEAPVGVKQIGNRLHRALEKHYVPGGPPSATTLLDALEREIIIDRSALPDDTDQDTLSKFTSEADLERIMLEGYVQWLQETGADSELEVIAPETYLEAEIMDGVAIIGKIDVRVRRKTDGAHLFIDHKSVGDLKGPTLMLPLDEQMLHYHLLEQKNVDEGEHAAGALYNMLRRVKRTARAQPPFYHRVEVRHNAHELRNFENRLIGEITDIRDMQHALEAGANPAYHTYPRPTRDCTWDCPFFAICPMFDDGSRVEDLITAYYDEVDPLEYYMTEMIGVTE